MRSKRVRIGAALCGVAVASGCGYTPERPLLQQVWAMEARGTMAPEQREVKATEIRTRWKVRRGEDGWGVAEDELEDTRGLAKGTKVVAQVPEGTHVQDEPVLLEGLRVEIIGKGPDRSRLVLDAGKRGFVLDGGTLVLRNLTVSCISTEGLTVLGGDIDAENVVINGARHGLYIRKGRLRLSKAILSGNEAGIDCGEEARLEIRDTIFHKNYDGLYGETPLSLEMSRCLVVGQIHKAFALRMGSGAKLRDCLIAENLEVGWSGIRYGGVERCLVQQDGFTEGALTQGDNRGIATFESFPDATPEGLPAGFPLAAFVLHRERLETLGTGRSVAAVEEFAEDEAEECLKRAERLCEVKAWRKASILVGVARGFAEPYEEVQRTLAERFEALEAAIAAGLAPSPKPGGGTPEGGTPEAGSPEVEPPVSKG